MKYLTRTIHQLEQIEAEAQFPAIRAASLLAETPGLVNSR